jgi:putative endonuclease
VESGTDAGRRAERTAARYLTRRGWTLLATNWRGGGGEIDIVAVRRGVVAVCEVKARRDPSARAEPVLARQRERLVRAAEAFLARRSDLRGHEVRFDVITVAPGRLRSRVRHLPGAFEPPGSYASGRGPPAGVSSLTGGAPAG